MGDLSVSGGLAVGNRKLGVVLGLLTQELETLREGFLPRHCSEVPEELLSDLKQSRHTDPVICQVSPWQALQPVWIALSQPISPYSHSLFPVWLTKQSPPSPDLICGAAKHPPSLWFLEELLLVVFAQPCTAFEFSPAQLCSSARQAAVGSADCTLYPALPGNCCPRGSKRGYTDSSFSAPSRELQGPFLVLAISMSQTCGRSRGENGASACPGFLPAPAKGRGSTDAADRPIYELHDGPLSPILTSFFCRKG
ncbi:hypothetical protein DV515_00001864, partial [Chloebia gouldiae]